MAMPAKATRGLLEGLGIPFLPSDHPAFESGPPVHFLSRMSSQFGRKRSGSTMPPGHTPAE